jgi:outer membrane protein insertion porin family
VTFPHCVRLPLLLVACLLLALVDGAEAQDQPLVTQIDVVGARRVEEATIRFKLKTRAGDPYSPEVVREDVKALFALGYFEDVVVRADIFEGGLKLTFELQEKPSIQSIKVEGNRKLGVDKIKGKIDLVEGAIIPPGALTKNAEKIRLFYEEEGYYQAQVEAREERLSPQEVALTFTVVEGDKFDVCDIDIVGNKHLEDKPIKKRLQTSEVFLWFFGGTLKREELQRDLDRIRAFYLDNGFLEIAVEEPTIQVDAAKKCLRIAIAVEEGPQYRIAQLSVTGNSLFSEAQIRERIQSRAGAVFSREGLQKDVVAVTDRYADRGYLFADVMPVTDIKRAETTVDVRLEITEGPQAFINRIEIAGNARTRDKVIRREIALVEGNLFSSSALERSRRRLDNLGFFEEVKIDTRRVSPKQVNLLVDVKEKPTGAFTIGGGFSSVDGPIGVVSISQANAFGLGKRASITAQLGDKANRFNIVYTDPHLMDSDYLLELRAYQTDTRFRTNQGFNQSTLGGAVTLGRRLFEQVDGSITYGYENVEITDIDRETAPELLLRQFDECAECATSSLTFALTRDTRDSFAEPTRGLRTRLATTYAGGFLDADNNFVKVNGEASQYHPLFWKFVGHLRGGAMYGEGFDDTDTLPVQERFYLGGPSTIRGFRNFTVSPKDKRTDTVRGGNKAWFVNGELLFPLYDPIRLRGVVFVDAGQAYDENDSFDDIFRRTIKRSAGIGIRFNSPLGAIRLDWGFNLNREENERIQVLHFSAGTSF